jgi:hypothetical protein
MTYEMKDPYRIVGRIYWRVSVASLRGVIDEIRTTLAGLVGELRTGMVDGEQVPSAEVVGQALQVAVHGNKHRITINHAAVGDSGTAMTVPGNDQPVESGFWTTSRRVWAAFVGVATIAGAVAAILALHPRL